MNKFTGVMTAIMVSTAVAIAVPHGANAMVAADNNTKCDVSTLGTHEGANNPNSKFRVKDGTAKVFFNVTGGKSCTRTVALKSYYAPAITGDNVHVGQKLFQEKQATYGPGEYAMSIDLPPTGCFYQVDFVRIIAHRDPGEKNEMLGFVLGGDKNCIKAPTPHTPQTPNTPAPTGTTTSADTTTTATTTVASQKLVNTGPGEVIAMFFGVVAVATAARFYMLRRIAG